MNEIAGSIFIITVSIGMMILAGFVWALWRKVEKEIDVNIDTEMSPDTKQAIKELSQWIQHNER